VLQVLLTNKSSSEVYLYRYLWWGASANLSLSVKEATSGAHVPVEVLADAVAPPPQSRDDFVRLPPAYIYGISKTVPLANINIRRTGTYELIGDFYSTVPATMNFGLPIVSREDGAAVSNAVTITVTN
jgi:hypothetical protein